MDNPRRCSTMDITKKMQHSGHHQQERQTLTTQLVSEKTTVDIINILKYKYKQIISTKTYINKTTISGSIQTSTNMNT